MMFSTLEAIFGSATGAMLNGLVKGGLFIAVVLLLDLTLRQYSAALRHRVWTTAFAALLVLPVAGYLVPAWHLPLIDAPSAGGTTWQSATDLNPIAPTGVDAARERAAAESMPGEATGGGDDATRDTGPAGSPVSSAQAFSWPAALVAIWGAGVFLLLARLGGAIVSAGRTARSATELLDDDWRQLAEQARQRLGIARQVRVVLSADVDMPMAWGLRHHTVLLPKSADKWSPERREVVLMHELAHVQRGDCAAQLVSSAAAALHWFNPLVWVARRRQAAERELACDDAVLSSGATGADYAWHLLEIARASGRARSFSPAGVMMARKSQLEGRLLAVLDPGRDRSQVSGRWSFGVVIATALLVLPLAGLRPWAAPTAEAGELPAAPIPNVLSAPPVSAPAAPTSSAPSTALPQDQATRDRVMRTMIDLLSDEDAGMRNQAAHSLGQMEDAGAVDALSMTVVSDASAKVRGQAAWALGMIESPAAVGALSQALSADDSASVQSQAAWALGMIEDEGGVTALSGALGAPSSDVRSQAAWALGMIESDQGVGALVAALQDDSQSVRSQAAWALGMIESADAVIGLAGALAADPASSVRSQAAWALGMIEDESALESLIDAVEDEDGSVRKQALWAISQIMG
jgi:beta-lactamase regulating signal transducer with metallopeptidase domain